MNLVNNHNFLLTYDNVLSKSSNLKLLITALENYNKFVSTAFNKKPLFNDWRKSSVIYSWEFKEFSDLMNELVNDKTSEVCRLLSIAGFETDEIEIQLTTHNDGDYYKWHTDNSTEPTNSRVVTFVYYFHLEPKEFSGGELAVRPPNGQEPFLYEPQNNQLVFFNSSLMHEVRPVVCPSGLFEHGRFTLNGWIRKK